MRPLVARAAVAALCALQASACASFENYLDPAGPRYTGQHATVPPAALNGRPLRVVTFNIELSRRISEAIAALQTYPELLAPDALCLQEMDLEGVKRIALAFGLNYAYHPSCRDKGSGAEDGDAVLSPWPIEETWKLPLPHTSRIVDRARAATAVRLRIGDRALLVYSIHFGSPLGISGGQRSEQAEAILADLRSRPEPAIVAGDTNSKGIGKVFLAAGLVWPTQNIGGTRGRFSFDHVFARGLIAAPGAFAGVVRPAKEASDHRPVWARLAVPETKAVDKR